MRRRRATRRHAHGLSIGISMFPDDAADGDALLEHADAGMYRAKAAGRENARAELFTRAREAQQRAVDLRAATRDSIDAARAQLRRRQ